MWIHGSLNERSDTWAVIHLLLNAIDSGDCLPDGIQVSLSLCRLTHTEDHNRFVGISPGSYISVQDPEISFPGTALIFGSSRLLWR